MEKLDLKKKLSNLYKPSARKPEEVVVPPLGYLMVDGEGDPNTSASYAQAVEALFSLSYTLKFMVKKGTGPDYGVMPLEGLWWTDDMSSFSVERKSDWKWTLMIMQPEFIDSSMVKAATASLRDRKHLPALPLLRFGSFSEGRCAQILHIGPFSEEGPTIAKLHRFIEDSGHHLAGRHHEIYLSDIRKADPKKWKTIIRQPMR